MGGTNKHNTGLVVIIFGLGMCVSLAILASLGVAGKGAFGLNRLAILLPVIGTPTLSLIVKKPAARPSS